MKITGNEPAKPITHDGFPSELDIVLKNTNMPCMGLTIRQQFAMAAMQGLCNGKITGDIKKGECVDIAECAVIIADRLIIELNKEAL